MSLLLSHPSNDGTSVSVSSKEGTDVSGPVDPKLGTDVSLTVGTRFGTDESIIVGTMLSSKIDVSCEGIKDSPKDGAGVGSDSQLSIVPPSADGAGVGSLIEVSESASKDGASVGSVTGNLVSSEGDSVGEESPSQMPL